MNIKTTGISSCEIEFNTNDELYKLALLSLRNSNALSFLIGGIYNTNIKARYIFNNIFGLFTEPSLTIVGQQSNDTIMYSIGFKKDTSKNNNSSHY